MEPRYPNRKSPSKLDDYEQTLTHWLFCEASRHRKWRKTIKQLHSDLVQLGYTGSYDRVYSKGYAVKGFVQFLHNSVNESIFHKLNANIAISMFY